MKIEIVILLTLFLNVVEAKPAAKELKPFFTITELDSYDIYLVEHVESKTDKVIVRIMNTEESIQELVVNGSQGVLFSFKNILGLLAYEILDELGRSLMVPADLLL